MTIFKFRSIAPVRASAHKGRIKIVECHCLLVPAAHLRWFRPQENYECVLERARGMCDARTVHLMDCFGVPFSHCVALRVITMEPYSQDSPESWKCTESSPALVIKPTLVLSILQCDRSDECVYGCNVKLSEDSMSMIQAAQDATVLWPSVRRKQKPNQKPREKLRKKIWRRKANPRKAKRKTRKKIRKKQRQSSWPWKRQLRAQAALGLKSSQAFPAISEKMRREEHWSEIWCHDCTILTMQHSRKIHPSPQREFAESKPLNVRGSSGRIFWLDLLISLWPSPPDRFNMISLFASRIWWRSKVLWGCFCQRTGNVLVKRAFLLACVRRSWRGGVEGACRTL